MQYVLSALLFAIASAGPITDTSAAQFAVTLYAPYRNAKGTSTGYSSLSQLEEHDIYSTSVFRILDAERARTPTGFEGALDSDPLCQCQDSEGMRLKRVTQKSLTDSKADVSITLRFAGSPPEIRRLHLLLVHEAAGWRVDDIQPSKGQTFKASSSTSEVKIRKICP